MYTSDANNKLRSSSFLSFPLDKEFFKGITNQCQRRILMPQIM